MLALGLLLLVPVLMWLGQSIMLRCAGQPIRWRISSSGLSKRLKSINRITTNASLAAVLVAYPLLKGETLLGYYARLFPLGRAPLHALHGFAAVAIYLALLYFGWMLTDNIRFGIRHRPADLAARLAVIPFSAVLGSTIEELMFRAVVLASLLDSFSTPVAIILGAVVFAAAHYVRRVKRYWTFPGHVALGLLLCVCFACTRTLWLPLGVHAGGIFMIMGARPLMRYVGPPWLVGASIFPYAGVAGIAGLSTLTINLWMLYRFAS